MKAWRSYDCVVHDLPEDCVVHDLCIDLYTTGMQKFDIYTGNIDSCMPSHSIDHYLVDEYLPELTGC